MVRAFGDEPVKLLARPVNERVVDVSSLDGETSSGFGAAFVYAYDERTFGALMRAYEHGDRITLRTLWSAARKLAASGVAANAS
jgi:hypothetical protein